MRGGSGKGSAGGALASSDLKEAMTRLKPLLVVNDAVVVRIEGKRRKLGSWWNMERRESARLRLNLEFTIVDIADFISLSFTTLSSILYR